MRSAILTVRPVPVDHTPSSDKQSSDQRGRISMIPAGQPYGTAAKTAQTRDTDGRGGNKESTPRGQGHDRDSSRDFAHSGQVVLGCIAVPDVGGGLPQPEPPRTTGPAHRENQLNYLPARGKFGWSWQPASTSGTTLHFGSLMLQNVSAHILQLTKFVGLVPTLLITHSILPFVPLYCLTLPLLF